MKLLIVLSVAVVGTFATNEIDAVNKCFGEHAVDRGRIQNIMTEGPVNESEECFLDCCLKEMEVIDHKGNINVGNAKKQLLKRKEVSDIYKELAVNVIDQCSKVECNEKCKCGSEAIKCLKEKFGGNNYSVVLGG